MHQFKKWPHERIFLIDPWWQSRRFYKDKFHSITYHGVTEGEQRYSSTLCFTSALCRGGCLTQGNNPVPIGCVGSGLVWMGAEKFVSTFIGSPDLIAHSDVLCRSSYSDPKRRYFVWKQTLILPQLAALNRMYGCAWGCKLGDPWAYESALLMYKLQATSQC